MHPKKVTNVSQGSATTHSKCGRVFNDNCILQICCQSACKRIL